MTDDFYRHPPRLETERLLIRPFTPADVEDYFAFASDPAVTRYLRWGPHTSRESTAEYLRYVLEAYARGEDSPWGIEVTNERKLIGAIHLMELDRLHRKAQLGVVLARSYWRRGYAAEAMRKVIDYCFTVLGLNRIEVFCIAEHAAAARMLKRVGMREEGYLRQYAFQKGAFQDVRLFAVLKPDYEERFPATEEGEEHHGFDSTIR